MTGNLVLAAPEWLVPVGVILGLFLVLVLRSYWRAPLPRTLGASAIALKIAGVVLLAVCLLDPLFRGVRPRPEANVFALLVDNSQSMAVADRQQHAWRERLRSDTKWIQRLDQDFDVRRYQFAGHLQQVTDFAALDHQGDRSDLYHALRSLAQRYQHRPVAGVLLISDGNATDRAEQLDRWQEAGIPIYPVLEPEDAALSDIRIEAASVSQTNFQTAPLTARVQVAVDGYEGHEIVVRLVDAQGTVIEQQSQRAEKVHDTMQVRFRFRPQDRVVTFYRVEAFASAEQKPFTRQHGGRELTWANNQRIVAVQPGGGPFRVLYLAGRPNWEYKFLRRALQADEEVELVALIRIARKEAKFVYQDRSGLERRNRLFEGFDTAEPDETETPHQPVLLRLGVRDQDELREGFPQRAEELFAYDAIILDDLEAAFFPADTQLLLRRFVSQRGGGFLMLGGAETFAAGGYDRTPLEDLLPVYLARSSERGRTRPVQYELTRDGLLEPWMRIGQTETREQERLAAMPSFRTVNVTGPVKPGAVVMAQGTTDRSDERVAPLVVTQRFGRGRTAAMTIGDWWRWAMRRQEPEHDELAQMWRQTVRHLCAEVPRRVELKLPSSSSDERMLALQVLVNDPRFQPQDDAQVEVQITTPSEKTFRLTAQPSAEEAGTYLALFQPQEQGGYRLRATATGRDGEEIGTDEAGWVVQPAAEEWKRVQPNRQLLEQLARQTGGRIVAPGELDAFAGRLPLEHVPVTEVWSYPYWHQPWWFGLALVCFCAEWGLRRWNGLP